MKYLKQSVALKLFICSSFLFISLGNVVGAYETITGVTVTGLGSYTNANGVDYDLKVYLSSPCPGNDFYLPLKGGNLATLSSYNLLLNAYLYGKKVDITYSPNSKPNFSNAHTWCEVYHVMICDTGNCD